MCVKYTLLQGVCKIYEEHLKRMNPNSPSITYDISQLFQFIDDVSKTWNGEHWLFGEKFLIYYYYWQFLLFLQLADLSCLVYQKNTNTYAPYNKVGTATIS